MCWKSILVIFFSPRHYCGLMVQAEVQTLTDPLDEVKRKVSVEKTTTKSRLLVGSDGGGSKGQSAGMRRCHTGDEGAE